MKTKIVILVILLLSFIGGFISFEKKKGKYGAELEEVKTEYMDIMSRQSRIEELKNKRAEYFSKVFMINRPGDENRVLTKLMNVLILMDNREVRFSNIRVTGRTGTFEFEITGFFQRSGGLLDFTDKLESSAGVFIISRAVDDKNPNRFVLKGEVTVE